MFAFIEHMCHTWNKRSIEQLFEKEWRGERCGEYRKCGKSNRHGDHGGRSCLVSFWIHRARKQSAPDSTAVVVYTVQPGDTLWRYAASITPEGGNVGDTVDELMRLNNLDTVSLHAGQRLIVPHEA